MLLWNKTHTRSVEASRVKEVHVHGDSAYRKKELWWQVVGYLDNGNNFDFGYYRTLPPAEKAKVRLNEQRRKAAATKPPAQKVKRLPSGRRIPIEERIERGAANILFGWAGKKRKPSKRASSKRRTARVGSIRRQ